MLEVEGGEEETRGTGEIKHYELCERRRRGEGRGEWRNKKGNGGRGNKGAMVYFNKIMLRTVRK